MPPFILVDGSYYLFRAFHALPPLTTSKGLSTNAIRGAVNALQKLMRRYQPTHMAVVFDTPEPTFRHQLSADYKAHRPAMPSELGEQIPYLHAVIQALGIPLLLLPGAEADDLMGTLAHRAEREGHQVLISTGDKDMAQLVNDNIKMEDSFRDIVLDTQGVIDKFGVNPSQIVDYLTLMGDASDGISGIPGIGKVTAVKLLTQYGNIGNLLEHADEIKGKVGQNIKEHAHLIPLNHQLASIVCNLPLDLDWHTMKIAAPDTAQLINLYTELEFKRDLQSLTHPNNPDNQTVTSDQTPTTTENTSSKPILPTTFRMTLDPNTGEAIADHLSSTGDGATYHTVLEMSDFQTLLTRISNATHVAIDTETTHLDYRIARLVGISIALQAGEAFYIPVGHDYLDAPTQLSIDDVLSALKPILENPHILKVGHHLKYDAHVFKNHHITLQGWGFDTMLASYVLNPTITRHGMDDLARFYLNHQTTPFEAVAGKGVKQLSFNQISLDAATPYACEDADITWQLYQYFSQKLAAEPLLEKLLKDVELPVAQLLWQMEENGITLDTDFLRHLGQRFGEQIGELEKQAFALAGQPFNVASPKQTGEILFDILGIAGGKKTASGQYATGEAILEKIEHPIAEILLEHRGLSKLKNTYTDRLIEQCHPISHRVHTSYNQATTATGRLSSTDPNLQNIPIRGETGRLIRQAFIAPENSVLLAADYSQIELRLMAHFSQDPAMLHAFKQGKDIHQATAAEVLGITLEEVTSEQRRSAKAINFGLLYGMSAFGLSKQLGLGRTEAQNYIDVYFTRYPAVRDYMNNTRHHAAEQGFVETILGRRLYTPEISSRNANIRQAAERAAINAPLQGSAADIIKLAMIAVNPVLADYEAKMLLQVHDELVFEVPKQHAETLKPILQKLMQEVVKLDVPLLVEVGEGVNWDKAH